jgi:uncharacterized protein YbaP (TraB family)
MEKDGRTSYMVGSIHVGIPLSDMPAPFWEIYNRADNIAVELDNSPKLLEDFHEHLFFRFSALPGQPRLSDILSPPQSAALKGLLKKRGSEVEFEDFDRFSVEGAYLVLADIYIQDPTEGKMSPISGAMDRELVEKARINGKVISYLEDFNARSILDCLSVSQTVAIERIRAMLDATAKPVGLAAITLAELLAEYRKGNLAFFKAVAKNPDRKKCLLSDRNQKWISRMVRNHEAFGSNLFMAGLSHMTVDESSLIDLLQAKGFKVKKLDWPQPPSTDN